MLFRKQLPQSMQAVHSIIVIRYMYTQKQDHGPSLFLSYLSSLCPALQRSTLFNTPTAVEFYSLSRQQNQDNTHKTQQGLYAPQARVAGLVRPHRDPRSKVEACGGHQRLGHPALRDMGGRILRADGESALRPVASLLSTTFSAPAQSRGVLRASRPINFWLGLKGWTWWPRFGRVTDRGKRRCL